LSLALSAAPLAAPLRAFDPGTALRARLTGFAGFLRANGFALGGADAVRVLQTTLRSGILDGLVVRWSLQALLCGRGDEWRRFDAPSNSADIRPRLSAPALGLQFDFGL
jgi:uncharacterized protein with von Willebrand factor type A (vWA) domain